MIQIRLQWKPQKCCKTFALYGADVVRAVRNFWETASQIDVKHKKSFRELRLSETLTKAGRKRRPKTNWWHWRPCCVRGVFLWRCGPRNSCSIAGFGPCFFKTNKPQICWLCVIRILQTRDWKYRMKWIARHRIWQCYAKKSQTRCWAAPLKPRTSNRRASGILLSLQQTADGVCGDLKIAKCLIN